MFYLYYSAIKLYTLFVFDYNLKNLVDFLSYRKVRFIVLSHQDTETQRAMLLCDFVTLCEHFLKIENSKFSVFKNFIDF